MHAAIEKTERLAEDVQRQRMGKAEPETESIADMEMVSPDTFAKVAESEFQYGAEAFESYKRENMEKVMDTFGKETGREVVAKSR